MVDPIAMVLFCPACGVQHVDAPDPANGWTNPPHRSHLCHACGHIWRPCDLPTRGVFGVTTCGSADHPRAKELAERLKAAEAEAADLRAKLNAPELHNFAAGVVLEAAHQRQRWDARDDAGKEPPDWFWLLGWLAGKAVKAALAGDIDKALHHCISSAAVLANWHAHLKGDHSGFRPGIAPPEGEAANG